MPLVSGHGCALRGIMGGSHAPTPSWAVPRKARGEGVRQSVVAQS